MNHVTHVLIHVVPLAKHWNSVFVPQNSFTIPCLCFPFCHFSIILGLVFFFRLDWLCYRSFPFSPRFLYFIISTSSSSVCTNGGKCMRKSNMAPWHVNHTTQTQWEPFLNKEQQCESGCVKLHFKKKKTQKRKRKDGSPKGTKQQNQVLSSAWNSSDCNLLFSG